MRKHGRGSVQVRGDECVCSRSSVAHACMSKQNVTDRCAGSQLRKKAEAHVGKAVGAGEGALVGGRVGTCVGEKVGVRVGAGVGVAVGGSEGI